MKIMSLKSLLAAGALSLCALLPAAPAQAGQCAAGNTCTFNFNTTNVTGMTVDIEVIINNVTDPLHTIITFNFLSDNVSNTALGIDQFAWGSANFVAADATSFPAGWSIEGCSGPGNPECQMDGFGGFDESIKSPGGTDLNVTFMLTGVETNFDATSGDGGEFALHIRYSNNCSAFVSDHPSNSTSTNANCTILRPVPEPGTLLLLGIAVAGIGYARSRVTRS